jgi:hypothetical protein
LASFDQGPKGDGGSSDDRSEALRTAPPTHGGREKADSAEVSRTIEGKLVLLAQGELTFTFQIEDAVTWDPDQEVVVILADGSSLALKPDPARSTRRGELSTGMVVRISLLGASSTRPQAVRLALGSQTVLIRLA